MEKTEIVMDYEKKYNEALERAQKVTRAGGDVAMEIVQNIFSELRESEDERIRKGIVETIKQCPDTFLNPKNRDRMLTYLEKQKEQKPVPKFSVGDYVIDTNYKGEPLYQIVGIDKECYICEYRGDKEMGDRTVMHFVFNNPYLRLEQKPADRFKEAREKYQVEWSDNDDQLIGFIFDLLNDLAWRKDWAMSKEECLERLKSLTMRCPKSSDNWRPSEEQMEVLYGILVGCRGTWGKDTVTTMESLYQNLKKLM